MRARRPPLFRNPEAHSRSRRKYQHQSRTRDPKSEASRNSGGDPRFGVSLQREVERRLAAANVTFVSYPNDHPYARSERVELTVAGVEFQYTLRHDVRGKITAFLKAAIVRASAAMPRVYLEIDLRHRMRAKDLAHRVVRAIRGIVTDIRSFDPERGNVIGLTMSVDRNGRASAPRQRTLFDAIGSEARTRLRDIYASIVEARAAAKPAAAKPPVRATPFWPMPAALTRLFHAIDGLANAGFVPHPAPSHAVPQTRLPRRIPSRR